MGRYLANVYYIISLYLYYLLRITLVVFVVVTGP
jgi:hypothetical protein